MRSTMSLALFVALDANQKDADRRQLTLPISGYVETTQRSPQILVRECADLGGRGTCPRHGNLWTAENDTFRLIDQVDPLIAN